MLIHQLERSVGEAPAKETYAINVELAAQCKRRKRSSVSTANSGQATVWRPTSEQREAIAQSGGR